MYLVYLSQNVFLNNTFSDLMSVTLLTLTNPGTISASKDFILGKHNFSPQTD